VNYYVKGNDMYIKYSNYEEFQTVGKPPHAFWDKQLKQWIVRNYSAYLSELYNFLGIKQSDTVPEREFFTRGKKIYLDTRYR